MYIDNNCSGCTAKYNSLSKLCMYRVFTDLLLQQKIHLIVDLLKGSTIGLVLLSKFSVASVIKHFLKFFARAEDIGVKHLETIHGDKLLQDLAHRFLHVEFVLTLFVHASREPVDTNVDVHLVAVDLIGAGGIFEQ